nr:hypothetical protein Iba_chr05aCG16250 [Ipomoea batatas]GMC98471.1 hypothetical protein Iba_chr05dCG16840 [Ipomoea batatas]GMD00616.1 hypothetical protein Iba_chr05eCG16910 [Ipomoea batatas]GMD02216.1 hypothetical protein Iba_chr05fCG14500 [Ipomoea batatas]
MTGDSLAMPSGPISGRRRGLAVAPEVRSGLALEAITEEISVIPVRKSTETDVSKISDPGENACGSVVLYCF